MEKDNLNLPEENGAQADELHEKQVFSGDPIKPSEHTDTEEPEKAAPDIPLDLHTAAVLDKTLAEKKGAAARAPRVKAAPAVRFSRNRTLPKARAASGMLLASGETPAYAAKRIAKEFLILLLFLAIVCFGFWAKNFVTDFLTDGKYGAVYQSSVYSSAVKCSVPAFSDSSIADGYRIADALAAPLGGKTNSLPHKKAPDDAMFATDIGEYLRAALPEREIIVKADLSNLDLLTQIHESLAQDVPVIVLLAEGDRKGHQLQYALVTEMDAENDRITVDSPNFGKTDYEIEAFLEATRFKTYKDMPFLTTLALTFGSYAHNTAIFVE